MPARRRIDTALPRNRPRSLNAAWPASPRPAPLLRAITRLLQSLAADPIDEFFDHVMVNADDAALRANRLGLLAVLHGAMNRVADLSKLST